MKLSKMIDGKQMTLRWHVDDTKASHKNPKVACVCKHVQNKKCPNRLRKTKQNKTKILTETHLRMGNKVIRLNSRSVLETTICHNCHERVEE